MMLMIVLLINVIYKLWNQTGQKIIISFRKPENLVHML